MSTVSTNLRLTLDSDAASYQPGEDLTGRYFVEPIGIPVEAEEGIVPPDGEYPPARLTQVNWQEPGGSG